MTSPSLLSILTSSEKRKEILFLLQEKPRTLSEIKEHFTVKSPEILPRLKEMEAAKMIIRQDGLYSLAPLGTVAAMYYRPLLDTLDAIEANGEFWGEHDLSAIPDELLFRIQELKECKVITETEYSLESHRQFIENVKRSKCFKGVTSVFIPSYPKMFLELALSGMEVSIIVTEHMFKKIQEEYAYELEEGLKCKNASMRVLTIPTRLSFAITDMFFSLSLFTLSGAYDHQNDLEGFDYTAVKWGEAVFNYYLENSIEVPGLCMNEMFSSCSKIPVNLKEGLL
jgi:predicted transcriptional regulator